MQIESPSLHKEKEVATYISTHEKEAIWFEANQQKNMEETKKEGSSPQGKCIWKSLQTPRYELTQTEIEELIIVITH